MVIPAAPAEVAESVLPVAEVTDGIRNLSDADKYRLKRASQYLGDAGARPPADLRHEAIRRAIAGSRKCPRYLPVVAFLIGTMRSIAHADRKALKRTSRASSTHYRASKSDGPSVVAASAASFEGRFAATSG
jgi:hypothetical protein